MYVLQTTTVGANALLVEDLRPVVLSNTEVDDATHPNITQQVYSCLSLQMSLFSLIALLFLFLCLKVAKIGKYKMYGSGIFKI